MKAGFVQLINKNKSTFHPLVPFQPAKDNLLAMDFSESNRDLTGEIFNDTNKFSAWVKNKLQAAGARYGIGGYAEHRSVYGRSRVFDAAQPGEEPRRFHLGTDIWGEANTPVMAPLEAIVHSFAFHNEYGNYGVTIILTHHLEGCTFYTLYGHLSLNSIKNLQEGLRIGKGDVFAEFGMQFENGHWPPHLHFQIILDLEGNTGDYPGVCRLSEKEKYLANCPDPDLILQMNRYL